MRKRQFPPLFREPGRNCSSLQRTEPAGQQLRVRRRETFRQLKALLRGKKTREVQEQKEAGLRKAARQEKAVPHREVRQEEAGLQRTVKQEKTGAKQAARQEEAGQRKAEKQEETVPRKEAQLAEAGLQRTVKQEKTGLKQAARRQKAKAREEAVCRRRIRRHPAARNLLREGLSPRLRTKAGARRRLPACPAAACRRQKAGRRLFS